MSKFLIASIVLLSSIRLLNAEGLETKDRRTAGKPSEYQQLYQKAEALVENCTAIFKNGIAGMENAESAADTEKLIKMIDQDLRDEIIPQGEVLKKLDAGIGEKVWGTLGEKVNIMINTYMDFEGMVEQKEAEFENDKAGLEKIIDAMERLKEWQQGYYK